ncbi:transcription factor [Pyrrhoderma noxium]|uniref:Transcription factor n=1 Tax=Pyrrhoderma noxium TaxID=2282107 RepID=A0A286UGU7_9AGAM|nr:transcription factor [Pyrrhoderma noxium]
MAMKAIVKYSLPIPNSLLAVISGDSLVLRGRPGPQGQPPKERILHLADVTAPRLGTQTREDEPWAFESREFLRSLWTEDIPRDLGIAELNSSVDLQTELLRAGWAKTKELKRDPTDEDIKRQELEEDARKGGRGMWNPQGAKTREVHQSMPVDSQAFLQEWKGKSLDAIVESVRDGSSVRVRLLMPEGDHQMANIALAGIRSPRASGKQGEVAEQWGDEAKFFTESRILQRAVRVQLLSLPAPTATPFQLTANGSAPVPASLFIGNVLHPAGNVAEHLVANGLARVVDWHAGMLAAGGGMERLRAAERAAKEKRVCLYASLPSSSTSGAHTNGSAVNGGSRNFEAIVVRVWSGDQVSVIPKEGGKERRIQLSSTRAPKLNDAKQAYFANEAREFLRKKLIGKTVKVHIDFIKPKEGEYEERECATIRYGGSNANIAEQLIEKGLATALRHKRDDEDRSSDYDKLMAAEQKALEELKGVHSGKDHPQPKPPINVSETAQRANSCLSGFKRQGRIPAVVEFVASGSRFKILIPKENMTITLVLAGIRAPRTARSANEKSEPYGNESAEFSTRRYMQRDVEVEIDTVDKSGGFIGSLYLNKTENAAITLVREGLASVHEYSAENLPWAKLLYDAEAEAKQNKTNIWSDYDPEVEAAALEEEKKGQEIQALKTEYMDVIISDVRDRNGLSFSVQILNTEGIAALEKLMQDFSLHHRAAAAPSNFVPKGGDLVSAKFSDGSWYRAKVRRSSPLKKEAELTFIDYGNQDTVAFKDIRPLDPRFRSLPGQAQDARLSFIKLVDSNSEYHPEAVERFRALCEGRKLVANVDFREGSTLHLRLIDPTDPAVTSDSSACVNADLVREGLASIDRKGCKYLNAYPQVLKKLQESVLSAKRDRLGMFEFGDVEEDDD